MAEATTKPFGEMHRELRERQGMTQFDLASVSGISQSTVSALETGKQRPWPSTRKALAAAFDMTLEQFDQATTPVEQRGHPSTTTTEDLPHSADAALADMQTMISRLLQQAHRAEDRLRTIEQELSLVHRVIDRLPIILWTTDRSLRLTSAIGWASNRLKAWSDAIGREIDQIDWETLGVEHIEPLRKAHQDALRGEPTAWREDACFLRVEPVRGPTGDIRGTIGLLTCS